MLSWDVPPEEQYIVKWRVYKAINGGAYSLLKTVKTCSATVMVYSGERRCFKVKAVNELGQVSPYSTEVCLEGG